MVPSHIRQTTATIVMMRAAWVQKQPKKIIGLQQTMNYYFDLARFSCVMSILILVSILVQCLATDVQVRFVLF